MKRFAALLPLAEASWPKYSDTLTELTGTDCDWSTKTRGVYSDDISCVEGGGAYLEGEQCTLQCPDGKVPTYAVLECKKGEFHPPGFFKKFYWDDTDIAMDFQVYCTTASTIPAPGIKRGMSIWNHASQHKFYETYNTVWNNATDPTIGWFYTWNTAPNEWAFKNEYASYLDPKSHYWPIFAYPPCSEATHPVTGDGSCDPATCDSTDSCTGNRYVHEPYGAYAENYFGIFNEPYGSGQANFSPEGTLQVWNEIEAEIAKLATAKGVSTDDIKIIGPSIAHKTTGMDWANAFYPAAEEAGIRIDYLNLHAYQMKGNTVGGPCDCDVQLLRDQLSHIYTKYEKPIWLTEYNCGNGYWNCPLNEHQDYMTDTLPMLEEHPFVPRYNWMSALTENDVEMNDRDTFQLNALGIQYNQYKWDGVPRHNPQWGVREQSAGDLADSLVSALNKNPICNEVNTAWNSVCEDSAKNLFVACYEACSDSDCKDACQTDYLVLFEKCPCRQNCFNGCPCQAYDCRPHVDAASDPVQEKKPVMNNPVQGLHLFQSDEFETESNMWNLLSGSNLVKSNYAYADGELKMKFTEDSGSFNGHRRELQYENQSSHMGHIQNPIFGYWEARIDVDAVRNGRSCYFYLIPEAYDLNPDDSTTDKTARKGARIDILNQSVWPDNQYKTGVQWDGLEDGTQSSNEDVSAPNISDGWHTFGLLWTAEKLEWYFDGEVVRTEEDQDQIPNQYPLYPRLETSIVSWLIGGPSTDDPWPAECKFDYVRHFVFDQVNPNCEVFDLEEMAKCEAQQRSTAGADDQLYSELIADNCPCHLNCFQGCENCGTWDCPNRKGFIEWVDPETPAWAQPDGVGNENNPDGKNYKLVYSDEFNGDKLNTNKWHLRDEQGKTRNYINDINNDNDKIEIYTLYEPKHNYLDGNGHLVQRWTKNPNDPPQANDDFKDCFD